MAFGHDPGNMGDQNLESLYESRWHLASDMNGDAVFTMTDISILFRYFLYAPGDGLIYFASQSPGATSFFEISPASYYSSGSLVVSIIVWLFALGILGSLSN